MKTRQPINQIINFIRRDLGVPELAAVLDLYPGSILFVDASTGFIRIGNSKATVLTGYTKNELHGLDLRLILPDFAAVEREILEAENDGTRLFTTTIITRTGIQTPVEIRIEALATGSGWSLISIEPVASQRKRQAEIAIQALRWDALRSLVQSIRLLQLQHSFETALESAHHLTGSGILALYRLAGHETNFVRYAAYGESGALPEEFDEVERTSLHRPTLWTPGKLTSTGLERAAKTAGYKYLITYPLIDKNTLQGLLVLGDRDTNPPDQLMQICQLIADAVTASVETKILINNLYDRIALNEMEIGLGRSLAKVVDQGIIVTGKNLLIEEINPAAESKLGYRLDEVLNLHLNKVLIGPPALEAAIQSAREGHKTADLGIIRIHTRSGRDFPALIKLFPVMRNEKVVSILVLIQDQTEWESLRRMNERLEPRAYQGDRLNEFSHDARNKIAGIKAGTEVLMRRFAEDSKNLKVLENIESEATKLEKRLQFILESSTSGEYRMAPLDITGLIRDVLDSMVYQLSKARVDAEIISSQESPVIHGDRLKLELVFENMISNSVQALKETGGRLTFKVRPVKAAEDGHREVEILVSDTGPGIPDEAIPHIFGQYYTTSSSRTGLGLSIVRRIVLAHGGEITHENMDGGTIFRITLPLRPESPQVF